MSIQSGLPDGLDYSPSLGLWHPKRERSMFLKAPTGACSMSQHPPGRLSPGQWASCPSGRKYTGGRSCHTVRGPVKTGGKKGSEMSKKLQQIQCPSSAVVISWMECWWLISALLSPATACSITIKVHLLGHIWDHVLAKEKFWTVDVLFRVLGSHTMSQIKNISRDERNQTDVVYS